MKNRTFTSKLLIMPIVLCISSVILIQGCSQKSPAEQAKAIFEKSGIQGGLVVHLNCGNGTLTEALKANDSYLVQGLDPSDENVLNAREFPKRKRCGF
jgi:2-polyprenyl-3-methyl-5-hydroxy-6-metoxy-1,4-benzoquinol methylase